MLGQPLRSGPTDDQRGEQAGKYSQAKDGGKSLDWPRPLPKQDGGRDHRGDVRI